MDSSSAYATMADDRGAAAATSAPARISATDLLRSSAAQRASASAAASSHSSSVSSSPDSSPPHSLVSSTSLGGSYSSSRGDESLLAGYSHGDFEAEDSGRARAASSSSSSAVAASSSSHSAAAAAYSSAGHQSSASTRRHTDDGGGIAALAGASSSSSSFLETADADPSAGFGGELLFDDRVAPASDAAADGSNSSSGVAAIDSIARSLRRCSCSPRDIRVLLMLLPLTTVVLFATNQKTAAFVLLGFTIVVGAALVARIVQIMGQRRRRQQQYGRLDPAEEEGGGEIAMVSLGAALGLSPASGSGSGRSRGGQGRGARYHSSLLHPAARHNPTALRLAMADRDFGPNDYDLLLRLDSEHQAQVFTGIPASQIQRLPTWRVPKATPGAAATASKENVCAVCLEDKVEGEMVRTLPCLHAFHVPCIDPWLQSHVKCPVCQFKVQFPD